MSLDAEPIRTEGEGDLVPDGDNLASAVSGISLEDEICLSEDAETKEKFKHTPLPNSETYIRLLELEPGSGDDDIVCILRDWLRNDLPPFEAISYTWGDEFPLRTILIAGKEFHVRKNCWDALRQVRHAENSRTLWIDAICINQDDIDEKGHQVQRMAPIFKNAETVLASLAGGDDDYIEAGDTAFLSHWLNVLNERWVPSEFINPPFERAFPECYSMVQKIAEELDIADLYYLSGHYFLQEITFDGFERLLQLSTLFVNNPYWTRVWVQPELALASNILFYYHPDKWVKLNHIRDLMRFFEFIRQHQSTIERLYGRIHSSWDNVSTGFYRVKATLWSISGKGHSNRGLARWQFHELRLLQCSDPRDRIYAFVPLLEGVAHGIVVDYRKTRFEVAYDVLSFCKNVKDVDDLLECLHVEAEDKELEVASLLKKRRKLQVECSSSEEICALCHLPRGRHMFSYICEGGRVRTKSDGGFTIEGRSHLPAERWDPSFHKFSKGEVVRMGVLKRHHVILDESGDEVLAILPKSARSGDLVVPLRMRCIYACLVLRNNKDEIYEIVGQSLVRPGYVIPQDFRWPALRLFIDYGDAVASAVQLLKSRLLAPDTPPYHLLDEPFTTTRFSSYAVYRSNWFDQCELCGK